MWTRSFRALKTTVQVGCECDRVAETLDALLASYPGIDAPAQLRYRVSCTGPRYSLWRDEELLDDQAGALDVAPIFELDLFRQTVYRAEGCVVLHAAAVSRGDQTLVMVGPSGAGKTTLTRALLERGWAYLSEECVAIDEGGAVFGLARPINLDSKPPLVPPGYALRPYRWLDHDDGETTSYLLHPPATALGLQPGSLTHLRLIAYEPGCVAAAKTLSIGDALARIWPCVHNPSPAVMDTLSAILDKHPLGLVVSDSVEAATTLLTGAATI